MRLDVIPAETVNSEGADVESENVVRVSYKEGVLLSSVG